MCAGPSALHALPQLLSLWNFYPLSMMVEMLPFLENSLLSSKAKHLLYPPSPLEDTRHAGLQFYMCSLSSTTGLGYLSPGCVGLPPAWGEVDVNCTPQAVSDGVLFIPDSAVCLYMLPRLTESYYYHSHFAVRQTRAQRGEAICLRSHST